MAPTVTRFWQRRKTWALFKLVAAVIAWRTKNVLLTIGGGMAALWLLQWFMS